MAPSVKAILLGDTGVGKTSLIARWTTGAPLTTPNPTIGASHQHQCVDLAGRPVDLFVWDTAGQERFHAVAPLYARSSSVAILVASIVDSNSFDSIDRWVELLGDANEKLPPIVLAVNKIDLADGAPKSADQIGSELHDKFAGLFFVSAATGEQVTNLFLFAAQAGLRFLEAGQPETVGRVVDADDGVSKCC